MRLLAFWVLLSSMLFSIEVGKPFVHIKLPDQFGKVRDLYQNNGLYLVAHDKDSAVAIKEYLLKQPKDFLQKHKAIFISDIHSMPSFVTKWFALPKMQKYPFQIYLIYNKEENIFPYKEDYITVIKVENSKVSEIHYEKSVEKIFQ